MLALLAVLLSFQLVSPEIVIDESFDQLFLKEQARVLETPEVLTAEQAIEKLVNGEYQPTNDQWC